jgi:flagellar biosynthesis GTPase FlhF
MSAFAEARVETRAESHPGLVAVPAVRDLARRLLAQGASPGFTQRVVARVEALHRSGRIDESAHPLDLAARVIGESHARFALPVPRGSAMLVAVLGARGSGRSAFVRKLALRLCGARRRVAVLAVRQPGTSKPEWVAAWASEIGARACVIDPDVELARSAVRDAEVILVDGSGDLERDVVAAESAARILAPVSDARGIPRIARTRIAVLAADSSSERLRAEARALRAVRADCCVLTRLDLASTPASAFEIAAAANLPVAFVSCGASEEHDLHRSGPELAADVFLKGRIA